MAAQHLSQLNPSTAPVIGISHLHRNQAPDSVTLESAALDVAVLEVIAPEAIAPDAIAPDAIALIQRAASGPHSSLSEL